MLATLLFSGVAAALVWLAGRRDAARDPRLTTLCLALLAALPFLTTMLPKLPLLPPAMNGSGVPGAIGTCAAGWWSGVWLAGFAVCAARLVLGWRRVAGWRARAAPIGREDGVEILQLEGLAGPVAAGVWRRVVLVPGNWRDWPAAARQVVLEHELGHHRRHDLVWRWIAELACAVHWFNPLVIWMTRRLTAQCEFACDAGVLRSGVDARAYARVLCDCAAHARPPRGPMLAMSNQAGLESRVRRLVRPARPARIVPLLLLCAMSLAAAGALAMLGPRPATRSTPEAPITNPATETFTPQEVNLRWTAKPFPGSK